MLLQSPRIQTRLAQRLSGRLSEGIEGEVTIGRVQILPFRTLIIRDLVLTDDNPLSTAFFEPRDTVARIGIATVSFSLKGLTSRKPLVLKKVAVRDGLFNMVLEEHHKSNLKRIFHQGDPHPMEDKGEVLLIRQIDARNVHFRYSSALGKKKPKGYPGINWADIDLMADVRAHDLHVANAQIQGIADEIRVREKSGYGFSDTHGRTVVSNGKVEVYDFELNDSGSHISIPSFVMDFENIRSFEHFAEDVTLTTRIKDSRLDGRTLTGFTGRTMPRLSVDIPNARFHGTLNDFELATLQFREQDGLSGTLSASVRDILHPAESQIDASLSAFSFTTAALGGLLDVFAPGKGKAVSRYAPGERFVLDGKLSGPARDLTLTCGLAASSGSVSLSMKARDLLNDGLPSRLKGSVLVNDLDVGSILGTSLIRECSLRTQHSHPIIFHRSNLSAPFKVSFSPRC